MLQLQSLLILAATATAQTTPTRTITTTFALWPTGIQDSRGSLEATIPIPCGEVCALVFPVYAECYLFLTTNVLGQPKDPNNNPFNTTACNEFLCTEQHYGELSGCLNCIVANGDERPFGYHTNSSLVARATTSVSVAPRPQANPNGRIDANQANGILKNVTGQCASAGTTLESSTITATPTTTGPYYTTWTSGAEVDLSVWTGLTQYTDEFTKLLVTVTIPSASATSGPAGSGGSAPAASTSGAGMRAVSERWAQAGMLGGVVGAIFGIM